MEKVELVNMEDVERLFLESLRNNELPDCFLYTDQAGLKQYMLFNQLLSKALPCHTLHYGFKKFRDFLPEKFSSVCIGIGNGSEEQLLVEKFKDRLEHCCFIDINSTLVEMILAKTAPAGIHTTGIVSFFEDLEILKAFWTSPALYCLFGNRFCNYDGGRLLESLANLLSGNDYFLFNCLTFNPDSSAHTKFEIEQDYKSPAHVQFNASTLLSHGAQIDDFQFHLDLLLSGSAAGPVYRTRKSINFLRATRLHCRNGSVQFQPGERLSMGSIYKYSLQQLRNLLSMCGFSIVAEVAPGTEVLILCKRLSD